MTDLRQLAEDSYQRARELRAKEERLTGQARGKARQLRIAREEESRLAQDLADLKERIRHLEQKEDIRRMSGASRNGHGRP